MLIVAYSTTLFAAQHHRYKLVDIGTLGGPQSYGEINAPSLRLLNDSDVVGSFADTADLDPNAPIRHAFLWEQGDPMVDLNTLIPPNPGLELVAADNINERGEIFGLIEHAKSGPTGQSLRRRESRSRLSVYVQLPIIATEAVCVSHPGGIYESAV